MKSFISSLVLAATLTPLALTTYAFEADFGFGIDLTRSNLKLDNNNGLTANDYISDNGDALEGSSYAKMRVTNGFVTETGFVYGSSGTPEPIFREAFDKYSYNGIFVRAGYEWRVGKNFSITPLLGLQHTRLYFTEGMFLNSGAEEEIKITSTRPVAGLKLGIPMGQTFEMYYRLQYSDLSVGNLMQQSIGIAFTF